MSKFVNLDKPSLWKTDVRDSIDCYNRWFLTFAPSAFKTERLKATEYVLHAFDLTGDLANVNAKILLDHPGILPSLRMSTCPPIARDRLSGLSDVNKTIIKTLESGRTPKRMAVSALNIELEKISAVICKILDGDLLPWTTEKRMPSDVEKERSATVIADRLCGSQADPIIRNAQEERQLSVIATWLEAHGYAKMPPRQMDEPLSDMPAGTFSFRMNVLAGPEGNVRIPVDVVIQPKKLRANKIPILVEAKSAGDFTNTNKRRKEEAQKFQQLKARIPGDISYILFLCGYFDTGYLGYEAAEGIDWVWEHKIDDLEKLGL